MIIGDLGIIRMAVVPSEADAPLIVNSNTVLPLPVAGKRFEPVTGRRAQIVQLVGRIYQKQFPQGASLNLAGELSQSLLTEDCSRFLTGKRADHFTNGNALR